ncbi:regulator of chromosome condensation (RCC1) repeat-containing protein [Toxoplasma gondii FOU]|uniref:Regulator of chromosome condensation (RCC1) repeat-containing protein n=2 Tax=Toxoplasma gondii TaxID=5811 RepID=A0A086KYX4_TOXGO|nr:regulator of chromosome condensation (RCC1) repeat-containing protein [Toxoplasma gondii FOU]RQX69428.1 regulator of chromosome condensation (RCC1) repeat-containing protein [Toxoplasma gondii CAST]
MELGHEVQGESDEILPRRVEALLGLFVIHVVCGDAHTACIVENGNVWAWGTSRILGHGDPEVPPNRPACLRALNGKGVVQLSCASTFTVAFCDPQRVSAKATAAAAADVAACAAGVSVSDALGSSGAASVEAPAPALLKPSASGEKRDAGAESGTLRSSTKGDEEALAACAGVDAGGASLRPRGASACRKTGSAAFSAFPRVAGDADVSGATAGRAELEALGSTTAVTAPSAAGRLSPLPSAERDELLCEVGTISAALQAAQQENLLLVALLSGTAQQLREVLQRNALLERELDAMRKSSSDAGDRLATLREHYMQQIQQLQEQLAQQDTRLHAILASRGSQLLSSQGLLSRPFARPLPSSGASPPLSASSSAPLAVSAVDPGGQAFTPSSRASGAVAPGVSGAPEALTALPEETLEEALLDPLGQQPPPSRFLSFPSSPAFLPSQGVSPGGASSPRAARAASGVLGSTSPGASGSPETPPEAQGRSSKLLRQALGLGETPFSAHGLRVGREGRKRGGSLALFKSRGRDFLSQGLFADEAAAPSPLDAKKGENNGLALVPSQGDPSWASLLLTSSVDSGASARRHLSLEPSSVSGRSRGGARDKSGGLEGRSRGSSQSARVVTEGSSIPVFFLEEEM